MAWYRIGDCYARVPPKNGSTSFKMAICGSTSTANLNAWAVNYSAGPFDTPPDDGLPRYLAVRNPVSRFKSLWRSCQRKNYHSESFVALHGLEDCTPDALMDTIESTDNNHWRPQTAFSCRGAIPVLYDGFLAFLGRGDSHLNESEPIPCPELPISRIRAFYAEDFVLCDDVTAVTDLQEG